MKQESRRTRSIETVWHCLSLNTGYTDCQAGRMSIRYNLRAQSYSTSAMGICHISLNWKPGLWAQSTMPLGTRSRHRLPDCDDRSVVLARVNVRPPQCECSHFLLRWFSPEIVCLLLSSPLHSLISFLPVPSSLSLRSFPLVLRYVISYLNHTFWIGSYETDNHTTRSQESSVFSCAFWYCLQRMETQWFFLLMLLFYLCIRTFLRHCQSKMFYPSTIVKSNLRALFNVPK